MTKERLTLKSVSSMAIAMTSWHLRKTFIKQNYNLTVEFCTFNPFSFFHHEWSKLILKFTEFLISQWMKTLCVYFFLRICNTNPIRILYTNDGTEIRTGTYHDSYMEKKVRNFVVSWVPKWNAMWNLICIHYSAVGFSKISVVINHYEIY